MKLAKLLRHTLEENYNEKQKTRKYRFPPLDLEKSIHAT